MESRRLRLLAVLRKRICPRKTQTLENLRASIPATYLTNKQSSYSTVIKKLISPLLVKKIPLI